MTGENDHGKNDSEDRQRNLAASLVKLLNQDGPPKRVAVPPSPGAGPPIPPRLFAGASMQEAAASIRSLYWQAIAWAALQTQAQLSRPLDDLSAGAPPGHPVGRMQLGERSGRTVAALSLALRRISTVDVTDNYADTLVPAFAAELDAALSGLGPHVGARPAVVMRRAPLEPGPMDGRLKSLVDEFAARLRPDRPFTRDELYAQVEDRIKSRLRTAYTFVANPANWWESIDWHEAWENVAALERRLLVAMRVRARRGGASDKKLRDIELQFRWTRPGDKAPYGPFAFVPKQIAPKNGPSAG